MKQINIRDYFDDETINDLANKYANVAKFKSDFPHDFESVKDGYKKGFNDAIMFLESLDILKNVLK